MVTEGYVWDGCSCNVDQRSKYHCLKHGVCDCCGLRDKGEQSEDRAYIYKLQVMKDEVKEIEETIKQIYVVLSSDPNFLRAIEKSRLIIEKLGIK